MKSSTIDLIAESGRRTHDALEVGAVDKEGMKAEQRRRIEEQFSSEGFSGQDQLQMALQMSDAEVDKTFRAVVNRKVTPNDSMYIYYEALNLGNGQVILAKNAGVEAECDNHDLFEENWALQEKARKKRLITHAAVKGEIMSGRADNCLDAIANLIMHEEEYHDKG